MNMIKSAVKACVISSVLLLSASPVLAADACRKACNDSYMTCQKSGKSDDACMSSWGSCKDTCKANKGTPKAAKATTKEPAKKPAKPN